jgi:hypothetical protein
VPLSLQNMETLYRIGTFFILAGLALLIIFVVSIIGKETNGIYLLLSFAAFIVGFLLHRNKAVNDSGRFGTLRRMGERNRQRHGEGMNKKPQREIPPGGRRHPSAPRRETEEENNGNGNNLNE